MTIKDRIIEYIKLRDEKKKFYEDGNCDEDIKCPNFEICGNYDFPLNMSVHGGLCMMCDVNYGIWQGGKGVLQFKESECPICFELTRCVSMPNCNHFICIDDFKRCFYGNPLWDNNEPSFPYPELEDDYFFKNQGHPFYENDPIIIQYHKEWNMWDDEREINAEQENYLKNCPICRS